MAYRRSPQRIRLKAQAAIRNPRPLGLGFGLLFAALGLSWMLQVQPLGAQDLNAMINDQPTQGQTTQDQTTQPQAPVSPPSATVSPSDDTNTAATQPTNQASTQDPGDQENFTPANRCPRCALFSAIQMAESGTSCQDVIFQGAASYSVTGDFENSDMLEVDARTSCRISFFNDSPDRSIVIKLDRALRELILAPSPDLYSGYLLTPRSSIDLILRPGQIHRSVEAKNIVTWKDATQVGDAADSLFKIRIRAN